MNGLLQVALDRYMCIVNSLEEFFSCSAILGIELNLVLAERNLLKQEDSQQLTQFREGTLLEHLDLFF